MQLQAKYKKDNRFQIDERFKDDQESSDSESEFKKDDDLSSERQASLLILQGVMKKKIPEEKKHKINFK